MRFPFVLSRPEKLGEDHAGHAGSRAETPDLMLLSRTYRPSSELAPYVRRFYVFEAELPEEMVIEDFLLAETAFIRCLLKGDWAGEVAPGEWSRPGRTLFFGANELPFKVRVQGSFAVTGCAIRPSGWRALFDKPHHEYADRLLRLQDVWGELGNTMQESVDAAADDEGKIAAIEQAILDRIKQLGKPEPDLQMAGLEVIARTDSTIRIREVADACQLSPRQLARRCRESFGLSPKAVLRRSRFLDMATALRGFSSPTEQDLAALRYYDQSHLAREFRRFAHMTPSEFASAITPLQTAGLKLREESRFED